MDQKIQVLIASPLGPLFAVADASALYALAFIDPGFPCLARTAPIDSIESELSLYFQGKLQKFTTPLVFVGTPFQKQVWAALQTIPYGETRSYTQIAEAIGRKTAMRAVAQANGANPLSIIVPCHRVIYADGSLGGYSSGIEKKKWLLQLENASSSPAS